MAADKVEDFSCGVIPWRVVDGQREFLLIQHNAGHWAFPKGHPEKDETYLETAQRELKEETGLTPAELDADHPFEENYQFTKRSGKEVNKRVVYYVGTVDAGQAIQTQASEVSDFAWGNAEQTRERMTFNEGRKLFDEVLAYLKTQT